jgi:hypothetical protein
VAQLQRPGSENVRIRFVMADEDELSRPMLVV